MNFHKQEVVTLPGFHEQYIGFAIAALFFVIIVVTVLLLYYFLAKRRFGGVLKAGNKQDAGGREDE